MIPTLHIQLLGGFQLSLDITPITTLDSPRLQALLAYLLLQRTAPHARAHLAFQLWPDTTEAQAQANLRTLLHRFRHALPHADQFLHIDTQTVQWRMDAPYTLDVADVDRASPRLRRPSAPATRPRCVRRYETRPSSIVAICFRAGTTTGCSSNASGSARRSSSG